jgi:DNA repair exonuclease SbcCD ATPase subunit
MDYKLFTQIVVLNKEKYVPFMELGAADRRKIVEDILDISVFSYMSDNLKTRLSSLNNTIEDLKYERGKIETKIVGQRRLIAEASSNVDSQVANISASIKVLLNNKNALESDLEGLTDVLRAVSNVETELTDTEKRKREFESIATKFSVNVENLKKTLSFFEDNDNCPTCGQEIAEDTKNTKRHECTSKIDEISSHSSKLAVSYGEVIAKVNDLKTKVRDIQQKEAEVGSLQNQLRNIDREIQNKNNELSKLNQESKVHQYEEELDYLENELVDKTDELNGLMKSKDVYELARSILKDDGIKASIVRDYIEFINNRVNEYLATMEFYINIQLDENFNDSIKAVNREGFVYDNLSTGQKTRVSMAVYLALLEVASLKNSVVTNLLILDEIFEPLDPLGVQLVMKLLKEKFAHKNIFVITQRSEEFADMFRNEIKFRLVDGFTEKV